jgi:hypothetical protein
MTEGRIGETPARLTDAWPQDRKLKPKPLSDVRPRKPKPAKVHRSSQGFYCVWHGLTLSNWVRLLAQRPPVSWRRAPRLASISWQAAVNSLLTSFEELRFGRQIDAVEVTRPPLFVLGHWRSGTTLLHNLLSLDPQFASPNMYQVLFPTHFLTTESFVTRLTGWMVPKTRPMDQMPAGWAMPQEDELALLLLTGLSPYLMLAFQGQREKYGRFFELADMTADEQRRWKAAFVRLIKKLTVKTGKAICLKSPSHTFRVEPILELFPQAKFVFIKRSPYGVYPSMIHLRKTVFTENALGRPNFAGIEEDTLLSYKHCVEVFERTKSLIPPGQRHEMRFEDLELDPLGQMQQLYRALQLSGWPAEGAAIRQQLPELVRYRKNQFAMDEAEQARIEHLCREIFEIHGYARASAEPAAAAS